MFLERKTGLALAVLATMLCAGAAAADDARLCSPGGADPAKRLAACDRLLGQKAYAKQFAIIHENRGSTYHQLGQYDLAIAAFTEAIKIGPARASMYFGRGVARYSKRQDLEAVKDFDVVLFNQSKHAEALAYRGAAHWALKDLDKALEDALAALSLNGNNDMAHHVAGLVFERGGRYADAIASFTKAIAIQPGVGDYFAQRGDAFVSANDLDRASADLIRANEIDPTHWFTQFAMGRLHLARHNHEAAVEWLTASIKRNPAFARSYVVRGKAYDWLDRDEQEFADFIRAKELDPKLPEACNGLGDSYLSKGNSKQALAEYSASLTLKPDQLTVLEKRALLYRNGGEAGLAILDYDTALRLKPKDARLLKDRGLAYALLKRDDKAMADFHAAIEIDPKLLEGHYNIGLQYRGKGENEKALEWFEKIIAIDPKSLWGYQGRAKLLASLGKWEEALPDYTKLIEMTKFGRVLYLNERAWTLFKLDRHAEALQDAEAVLKEWPMASAIDKHAHILEALGRKEEAIAGFRKALSIQPDLKESIDGLTRLGASK